MKNINHLLECEEVIYEHLIFSNEKEGLDMGLSHSNFRINDFVLVKRAETFSETDKPIFFDKIENIIALKTNPVISLRT